MKRMCAQHSSCTKRSTTAVAAAATGVAKKQPPWCICPPLAWRLRWSPRDVQRRSRIKSTLSRCWGSERQLRADRRHEHAWNVFLLLPSRRRAWITGGETRDWKCECITQQEGALRENQKSECKWQSQGVHGALGSDTDHSSLLQSLFV